MPDNINRPNLRLANSCASCKYKIYVPSEEGIEPGVICFVGGGLPSLSTLEPEQYDDWVNENQVSEIQVCDNWSSFYEK